MNSSLRLPRIPSLRSTTAGAAAALGLLTISTPALAFGIVSYLTVAGAAVSLYLLFHAHGADRALFLGLCGIGATMVFVTFSSPEEAWTLPSVGKSVIATGMFIGTTVATFARDCRLPDHKVYRELLQSSVYMGLLVAAVLLLVGGYDLAVEMRSRTELVVLSLGAAFFTAINAGGLLGKGVRRLILRRGAPHRPGC